MCDCEHHCISDSQIQCPAGACGPIDATREGQSAMQWQPLLFLPRFKVVMAAARTQHGVTVRDAEHNSQCELCGMWFSYEYLTWYHAPRRNCVRPSTIQPRPAATSHEASPCQHASGAHGTSDPCLWDAVQSGFAVDVQAVRAESATAAAPAAPAPPPPPPPPDTTNPLQQWTPSFTQQIETLLVNVMSGSQLQAFLDVFKRNPGVAYTPSTSKAKQMAEKVSQESLGPEFKHIDIRSELGLNTHNSPPVIVSVRKNAVQLVKTLVATCPNDKRSFAKFSAPVIDSDGQRTYNEFWTAQKWEREQQKWGTEHPIVWLVFWSDKANYDRMGRSKGHPLTLTVANTSVEFQRSEAGCKLLALLPDIQPLKDEKKTSQSFRLRKAQAMQAAMKVAVAELKQACNGELLEINWPDGTTDLCRVRLAAFLADLEEQWDLLGIKHSGTEFSDTQYLIPASEITNTAKSLSSWEQRTEEDHKLRWEVFQAAQSTDGMPRGARALAQAALDAKSLKPVEVALWGFGPDNSIYQCFPVDRLHQDYNGVTRHLIEALQLLLTQQHGAGAADTIIAQINSRLKHMRSCHEAFYPTDGTAAVLAQAEEMRGLMKFLPIAASGLVDDAIVDMLAEYARWQQIRDCNSHTEQNVKWLEEWTDKLAGSIITAFRGVKPFNFPKMVNMRKYAANIREFGMISLGDTGPRERFNKVLRHVYEGTNRKLAGLTAQVADSFHQHEAVQQAVNTIPGSTAAGTGARQRATQAWAPSMSPNGRGFLFSNMVRIGTWEYEMCEAVPELARLPSAIQALFASGADSSEDSWVECSQDSDGMDYDIECPTSIEIKKTLGLPRYDGVVDVVKGHPALSDRRPGVLDNVAYKGCGADLQGNIVFDTWYGQVLAMGTVNDQDVLFVRNYTSPELVNAEDERGMPLTLRPLVWEPTPVLRDARGRRVVNTVQGSFAAISTKTLMQKVCIVPDYRRGDGSFLVNDLVNVASRELQFCA